MKILSAEWGDTQTSNSCVSEGTDLAAGTSGAAAEASRPQLQYSSICGMRASGGGGGESGLGVESAARVLRFLRCSDAFLHGLGLYNMIRRYWPISCGVWW
jgi:hypothetical protein